MKIPTRKRKTMTENEKITDLEIKISYLEGYIEDLNKAILDQNSTIETLRREITLLKGTLENKPEVSKSEEQ